MQTEKTAENSTAKKVLRIVGNVLIWIFIIFAALTTVLAFAAQSNADGIPAIAGRAILTVQSESMNRAAGEQAVKDGKLVLEDGWEKGFNQGDIIIGRKLQPEEQKALKVGDIVTFKTSILGDDGQFHDALNSHRIVEVQGTGDDVMYVTRGDNPETNQKDDDPISWTAVICKYTGTRLPGVGKVLDFLQTSTGFLVVIVLPLVAFFVFELVVFIRKFLKVKNAGKKQITAADEEAIKQKAIEEYLRQQQGGAKTEEVKAEAEEVKAEVEEKAEEAVESVEEKAEEAVEEVKAEAEEAVEEIKPE
ncbi:MAG: signal peptidase I [Clostridia bacterium]|nr:signal peptidase I [Clostridia bacterium]